MSGRRGEDRRTTPAVVRPFLLWNNWSLWRAGLRGWRIEASFDGEALCLAGRRRGSVRIPGEAIERIRIREQHRLRRTWRTRIWSGTTRRSISLMTARPFHREYRSLVIEVARALHRSGRLDRIGMVKRIPRNHGKESLFYLPFLGVALLAIFIDPKIVFGWLSAEHATTFAAGLLAFVMLMLVIMTAKIFPSTRTEQAHRLWQVLVSLPR